MLNTIKFVVPKSLPRKGVGVGSRNHHAIVAAAQIRATKCVDTNLKCIVSNIIDAAGKGSDIVCFPETALTGYFPETILSTTAEEIQEAINTISYTCRIAKISAIVGSPMFTNNGERTNSALVFSSDGALIGEAAKVFPNCPLKLL
jgi:NAD+ synthase (glutamine-hydrolysing)